MAGRILPHPSPRRPTLLRVRHVVGVDFSGAKLAGRTTWVATLKPVGKRKLHLVDVAPLAKLCGHAGRAEALSALVGMIAGSREAVWALGFPFGFPVEVMAANCTWAGQLDALHQWGEEAYALGVECYRRGLALGGKGHVRRLTDAEERTPFD